MGSGSNVLTSLFNLSPPFSNGLHSIDYLMPIFRHVHIFPHQITTAICQKLTLSPNSFILSSFAQIWFLPVCGDEKTQQNSHQGRVHDHQKKTGIIRDAGAGQVIERALYRGQCGLV